MYLYMYIMNLIITINIAWCIIVYYNNCSVFCNIFGYIIKYCYTLLCIIYCHALLNTLMYYSIVFYHINFSYFCFIWSHIVIYCYMLCIIYILLRTDPVVCPDCNIEDSLSSRVLGFRVRRLVNTKTLALSRFLSMSKDNIWTPFQPCGQTIGSCCIMIYYYILRTIY